MNVVNVTQFQDQEPSPFSETSVSARCRVPYAVEKNLRGMTE